MQELKAQDLIENSPFPFRNHRIEELETTRIKLMRMRLILEKAEYSLNEEIMRRLNIKQEKKGYL